MFKEEFHDQPLLSNNTEEQNKKHELQVKKYVSLAVCVAVGLLVGVLIVYFSFRNNGKESSNKDVLNRKYSIQSNASGISRAKDECTILEAFTCPDTMYNASGDMPEKWANHLWNTPKRGESDWKKGYQDMSTLVGYARQTYSPGRKSCTVTII